MKTAFEIKDGRMVSAESADARVLVYVAPSAEEREEILRSLDLDPHDLDSALDPDEISRVEWTPDYAYIVWKNAKNVSARELLKFEVSSVGIYLGRNKLVLIFSEDPGPFGKDYQGVVTPNDVLMRVLWVTVRHFLGHLKAIKLITAELETKLNQSMETRYLLQMFSLGESLVYYLGALEGNAAVLTKLRAGSEKIGLKAQEVETLDDAIIEHQQCLKQTQIYSSVLSGLMEARGSVINNNMNVLLKNLTIINVIFLPLNLIASIGGMSEFGMMTHGVPWQLSYLLLALGMLALGLFTWLAVIKTIERKALGSSARGLGPQ